MKRVNIQTETIRLSQLLKLADCVSDGREAKIRVQNGEVRVNGKIDRRRGRKLKDGDYVTFAGTTLQVLQD